MAHPMGFYAKHGLDVEVVKTAGWTVVRDKTLNREYDAAHMLAPMPIAISLGLGSQPIPFTVPAIENVNGQGITLAGKHKDRRDPKSWKGLRYLSTIPCTITSCGTISPSTVSIPTAMCSCVWFHRRKWLPIFVPTT
jgi:hypothetical protein